MSHMFELLDKKIPKGLNSFVRIWLLVFFVLFASHTYSKTRLVDDKVNSSMFDLQNQQFESQMKHQMELMELRHEASMKQIKQLNERLKDLDAKLRSMTELRNAEMSDVHVRNSKDRIEWQVFNEKREAVEDISHRFYGQFE